jgi:CRP-like cAMP-binding protein
MESREIEQALAECEFFRDLAPGQILSIAAVCDLRRCRAGETVFSQGGSGEHLYVVADGLVFLERGGRLGPRRTAVTVAMLGKGKLLGGWSTLLGQPHTLMLSAICQKDSTLVAVKGAELRRLMTADIQLGFDVLEKLCFLLRERIQSTLGALENI